MKLSVIYNDEIIMVQPGDDQVVKLNIEFPACVILDVSGKFMSRDTVVDENGNIVVDKHIELTRVVVDRSLVSKLFLKKWPKFGQIRDSYFGFNGQVELEFLEPNSFYWLLTTSPGNL